jgi:hypothetical protein
VTASAATDIASKLRMRMILIMNPVMCGEYDVGIRLRELAPLRTRWRFLGGCNIHVQLAVPFRRSAGRVSGNIREGVGKHHRVCVRRSYIASHVAAVDPLLPATMGEVG